MPEYLFTAHAKDMLKERDILESWVLKAIESPDRKHKGKDGNMHYFRQVPEKEHRVLHVVVSETVEPNRIVTLFLDRRRSAK